jgi:GNAT superfamily N-acetyltransferase/predicted nucleic acid-binding protein
MAMRDTQLDMLTIGPDSQEFREIVQLADHNTDTLGFIPEEALRCQAERGNIFAAVDGGREVCGYIWYSVTRSTGVARLHHLCVSESRRGTCIGTSLISELKSRTRHLQGIALRCLRENPACQFYSKMGFVPVDERPGRGKDAQPLTCFWLGHGHPDLITDYQARLAESKAVVVIDANVFFDLHDERRRNYKQSQALCADWVTEWAALWITNELFVEIHRHPDPGERKQQRSNAKCFHVVNPDEESNKRALAKLAAILPPPCHASDESDRRHLAAAIACEADFFLTRDGSLLDCGPQIAQSSGVEVCRPLEFILGLDESQCKADYQPARLAGSDVSIQQVCAKDVPRLAERFLNHGGGEKKFAFEERLTNELSDRDRAFGYVVRDGARDLGLLLMVQRSDTVLEIPLFRIVGTKLAPTLARHLLARATTKAACGSVFVVLLTDPHCPSLVYEASRDQGFVRTPSGYAKLGISGLRTTDSARNALHAIRSESIDLDGAIDVACEMIDNIDSCDNATDGVDRAERCLWPLKLRAACLPSFMVPIQARWAAQLFDEHLAAQDLFGADTRLALQCENVYYRAARRQRLKAPARVLWYVSSDSPYTKTRRIRACSRIEEVVVAPAQSLFKRYSRLGVYTWADVLRLANGDPNGPVSAFRFSGTELAKRPIDMKAIREVLHRGRGVTPQFTTALALYPQEFAEFYTRGFCADVDAGI